MTWECDAFCLSLTLELPKRLLLKLPTSSRASASSGTALTAISPASPALHLRRPVFSSAASGTLSPDPRMRAGAEAEMDPPAEKIPEVDSLKMGSPLTSAAASAVSKVLGDDDLLREIIVRVAFPSTLLRAALVCKRWFRHASGRAFLRRFRDLNPPGILGFYTSKKLPHGGFSPQFVPLLPLPQDPVLADLLGRTASSSFGAFEYMGVRNFRNGCVIFTGFRNGKPTYEVHSPMYPDRGVVAIPKPPEPAWEEPEYTIVTSLFSRRDCDGMSYLWFSMERSTGKYWFEGYHTARVFKLQNGVWRRYIRAKTQLAPPKTCAEPMLIHNKIYMAAADMKSFLLFDLETKGFCTVQLPEGVEFSDGGRRTRTVLALSPADDSGVYLIQVNGQELHLRVWLFRGDNWSLVDSIRLLELVLRMPDFPFMENDCYVSRINQVGNDAEFVLLEIDRCALFLDTKSRTLRKVYEGTKGHLYSMCPFMMMWPPTFPALKDDSARNASDKGTSNVDQ